MMTSSRMLLEKWVVYNVDYDGCNMFNISPVQIIGCYVVSELDGKGKFLNIKRETFDYHKTYTKLRNTMDKAHLATPN